MSRRLTSLAEARAVADGVVILQGDRGGQIYVIAPAARVVCDEAALARLLRDLDEIAWPGSDPAAATLGYERLGEGETVPGGMGGGKVTGDVWVHPELRPYEEAIRAVLAGTRGVLGGQDARTPGA